MISWSDKPIPTCYGVAIADLLPLGQDELRVTWLEQGRGNMIKVVHGFTIGGIASDDLDVARKMAVSIDPAHKYV